MLNKQRGLVFLMERKEMDDITKKAIGEFAKTLELFRLSTMEARLFAYLYMTNNTLTLDEMSDALGKSKTSISTNIRRLLELNLVQRVWKKGVRKDLYEANSPLFKTFMNHYLSGWINTAKQQKASLEEIYASMEKEKTDLDRSEFREIDRKSTRLNSSHVKISYAVFCLKKKR